MLSLKNTSKVKQTNERSFDLFELFSMIITSLAFDSFNQWAAPNACDHSLWNLDATKKYKNGGIVRNSWS